MQEKQKPTERVFDKKTLDMLEHILNQRKNILVTGESGRGKTALLRWIMRRIQKDEKLLIFDNFNELKDIEFNGIKVGYHNDADIVGDMTKINPHKEMITKALMFPFDRVIADDLYVNEFDGVLKSLHGERSGVFTVPFDTSENALKHIYLKTIYPDNKELKPELYEKISKEFSYVIEINHHLTINRISYLNNNLQIKNVFDEAGD